MAKLSSHGRELMRVFKETTKDDGNTDWQRITRAYFADGKILQKYDVHFKPDGYRPRGERYSYGWNLHSKLKKDATVTMEQYVAKKRSLIHAKPEMGWVIDGDSTPIVMISQARILRACESGENIGFCKACGAEADGCEPDARNYRCESCGQHEVYGTEEILIAG